MLRQLNKNETMVHHYLKGQLESDLHTRAIYNNDYKTHSTAYGIASDINRDHSLKTRAKLRDKGLTDTINIIDLISKAQVSRACGVLVKYGLAEKIVSDGRKKVNLYRLVDDEAMK